MSGYGGLKSIPKVLKDLLWREVVCVDITAIPWRENRSTAVSEKHSDRTLRLCRAECSLEQTPYRGEVRETPLFQFDNPGPRRTPTSLLSTRDGDKLHVSVGVNTIKYNYRGTSLIREPRPLGPYSRPVTRTLWWSQGWESLSYEQSIPVHGACHQTPPFVREKLLLSSRGPAEGSR